MSVDLFLKETRNSSEIDIKNFVKEKFRKISLASGVWKQNLITQEPDHMKNFANKEI